MRYIKGVVYSNTFAGNYSSETAKLSLVEMKKQSGCNTVVFVISAIQDTADSNSINYKHTYMPKDNDIYEIVRFAREIGLQTILKPEIICMNGETQVDIAEAHEEEGEESYWFSQYTNYIMHYAAVAKKASCDMFIIGCELVELEQKDKYWRNLICKIRTEYDGYLTYNANRCKEENVMWWDALDYISASGFYHNSELSQQIERIDNIRKKYQKPFFFSEIGCKSCRGSSEHPENWILQGEADYEEQSQYYKDFLSTCVETDTLSGMVIYNWYQSQNKMNESIEDTSYNIHNKPVCNVIRAAWSQVEKEE